MISYGLRSNIIPSGHRNVRRTSQWRPFCTRGRPKRTSNGRPGDPKSEVDLVRPISSPVDVLFWRPKDVFWPFFFTWTFLFHCHWIINVAVTSVFVPSSLCLINTLLLICPPARDFFTTPFQTTALCVGSVILLLIVLLSTTDRERLSIEAASRSRYYSTYYSPFFDETCNCLRTFDFS